MDIEFDDLDEWLQEYRKHIKRHKLCFKKDDDDDDAKSFSEQVPNAPIVSNYSKAKPLVNNKNEQTSASKKTNATADDAPKSLANNQTTAIVDESGDDSSSDAVDNVLAERIVVKKIPRIVATKQTKLLLSPSKTQEFSDWKRCYSNCKFNVGLFGGDIKAAQLDDYTTVNKHPIVCLRAMYKMKMLPGGRASGDESICIKIEKRALSKMPQLFPTSEPAFTNPKKYTACVREFFSHCWFRVCYRDSTKKNDVIHHKDLLHENADKPHFLALLKALFEHMVNKDQIATAFLLKAAKIMSH